MKRFLSAFLCAVLLLGMLPAVSPPARMDPSGTCTVNKTTAFVGDTITWTVSGVDTTALLSYRFVVYKNSTYYMLDDVLASVSNSYSFTPSEPGSYHTVVGVVYFSDWFQLISPATVVSLRPTPQIAGIEALSASSLRINWDPVTDASGYEVWRSTSATGVYAPAGTTAATNFIDASLTAATSYYYKVRTYNGIDGVDYSSSEFCAPEAGLTKAGLPATKITKIEAMSGTSLKITWNKVAGANGYFVERSTNKTGPYKLVKTTTASSFTNTYLKAGTRYYYRVRAYIVNEGVKWPSSNYCLSAAGVPLAKSAVVSTVGVSSSGIKLTWKKVTSATGYQILRSATPGGTYKAIKTTTALTYTAGGMQHAKTYYFKVRPYKKIATLTYYGPMSGYKAGKTK